jgi:hypothetical protein
MIVSDNGTDLARNPAVQELEANSVWAMTL